jgi:hypothetical protein
MLRDDVGAPEVGVEAHGLQAFFAHGVAGSFLVKGISLDLRLISIQRVFAANQNGSSLGLTGFSVAWRA